MECFNHHGKQAVGLCKFCMRGVCGDCARESEHHLACSEQHAAWAEGITQVQRASIGNVQLFRSQRYTLPLVSVALIALGLSMTYMYPKDLTSWIFTGFGVLMGLTHLFSRGKKKDG